MKIKKSMKRSCLRAAAVLVAVLLGVFGAVATVAESALTAPTVDSSPALYVAEKNENSVVGILTNTVSYNSNTRSEDSKVVAEGSGVVVAEGGYILTNYHVIENGDSYQILLVNGDKVDATVVGTDSSTDLAVLKVTDEEVAATLVPVTFAEVDSVKVGATVIAIGNPGGEILAHTVTQGIVSALERTSIVAGNTTRSISYIQHDAAINSGNSGGGLFNYKGELIGINTLKYSGSAYSSTSYEGLGFAIPCDTVRKVAEDIIAYGKVRRPGLGVMVSDYSGADEPLQNHGPASVLVASLIEGGAAESAGIHQYDFITAVDGERVTSMLELTSILDSHEIGDTVTVTVVRYNYIEMQQYQQNNSYFGYGNNNGGYYGSWPFGGSYGYGYGYGYGNDNSNQYQSQTSSELVMGNGYETIDIQVTLSLLN